MESRRGVKRPFSDRDKRNKIRTTEMKKKKFKTQHTGSSAVAQKKEKKVSGRPSSSEQDRRQSKIVADASASESESESESSMAVDNSQELDSTRKAASAAFATFAAVARNELKALGNKITIANTTALKLRDDEETRFQELRTKHADDLRAVKMADEKRFSLGADHQKQKHAKKIKTLDAAHRATAETVKKFTDQKHEAVCETSRQEHTRACDKSDAKILGLQQELQELQDDMAGMVEREVDEIANLRAQIISHTAHVDTLTAQAVIDESAFSVEKARVAAESGKNVEIAAAEKTINAQREELVQLKSTASTAVNPKKPPNHNP